MNASNASPTVLIAPLDWGLGHVTRCIPLIQYLKNKNCTVIVACNASQEKFLRHEITSLEYLFINGYNISYSKSKRYLPLKILMQVPKILLVMYRENSWLCKLIKQRKIDLIISDNRFGFYNKEIYSVFITHQLLIKAGSLWLQRLAQQLNYHYIKKYNECWVPDIAGEINISGILSHPQKKPGIPVKYLGPISRLAAIRRKQKNYDFAVVLSGPEPQRTIFEQKVKEAIAALPYTFILLRGVAGGEAFITKTTSNLFTADYLPAKELNNVIAESGYIISRCGYTTVMDVISLQKKSILIPTPGQTEQEYLAQHLMKLHWCYTFQQHENFINQIKKGLTFKYSLPHFNFNDFESVLDETINKVSNSLGNQKKKKAF